MSGKIELLLPVELYERAACDDAERAGLSDAVEQMVAFAERGRREGLLALEDDLDQIPDTFLRSAIQLVVDGTDPELIREICITRMLFLHVTGVELLRRIIYTLGALMIQSGDNPRIIQELLSSFVA